MRRFKFGWVLIALASLAIGLAVTIRWRNLNELDRGRDVEAKRLSKRAPSIKENRLAAKQSETAAILERLAPVLHESGQPARVEDPTTRKEPLRIKTH
jgi:hypothetical protein